MLGYKTTEDLNCPVCDSTLKYHKTDGSHIWSCKDCPCVLFEFYETADIMNLATYLKEDLKKPYHDLRLRDN